MVSHLNDHREQDQDDPSIQLPAARLDMDVPQPIDQCTGKEQDPEEASRQEVTRG